MVRIAFCGRLASGKTTASQIIEEMMDDVNILSFASRLKELATELYGMPVDKKNRSLLQNLGQKMKEIDHNVWVNAVVNKINKMDKNENIIIDDLRFPNEWEALKSLGFIIIRLKVEPSIQIERIKKTYPDNWGVHLERLEHITEIALKNYYADYTLESNDHDILYNSLVKIVKSIKK